MNKKLNFSDFFRDKNITKFQLNNQKLNLSAGNLSKLDTFNPINAKSQVAKNDFLDSDYSDDEASSDEENEAADDIFLCFLYKNGKLGCASYVNFNSIFCQTF
jgi:hypothetical protein